MRQDMPQLRGLLVASVNEVLSSDFHVDCVADGIGTLLLTFYCVFIGCTFDGSEPMTRVAAGALIGSIVYGTLETLGHLQWAAINPIVATAFFLTGKISFIKSLIYIMFELAGASVGAYTAYGVVSRASWETFSAPALDADVTWTQGYVMTLMITWSLIFVIIGSLDDVNRKPTVPALAIGVTTAYGIIIGSKHSAGISNQAVCFGIALVTGNWKFQELWWAGGYSGCFLAVILYKIFSKYGGKDAKRYANRMNGNASSSESNKDEENWSLKKEAEIHTILNMVYKVDKSEDNLKGSVCKENCAQNVNNETVITVL